MPRPVDPEATLARKEKLKMWWAERVKDGTQLAHIEEFQKGWDYKGDGPWFPSITVQALYVDFIMRFPEEEGRYYDSVFSKNFRALIPVQSVVRLHATIRKTDGGKYATIQRTFFRFGAKPPLDASMRAVLDGALDAMAPQPQS